MAELDKSAIGDARELVRNLADQQVHKVAGKLDGVAQALHETARHLEGQHAEAGRYAEAAARQVESMTRRLQDRRMDQLVDDAEDFARGQPLLFLGGALAAGFVLARVLKSGEPRRVSKFRGDAWRRPEVDDVSQQAAGGSI